MSTVGVFRKDFLDVRRARIVWFVCGVYTLLMGLLFYVERGSDEITQPLGAMTGIGLVLLPLVALVAAYLAIAGERESGSIKYLLSLPNSRLDVVLGKFLSRSLVVVGAIVLAFAVAAVMGLVWYASFDTGLFLQGLGLVILYVLAYVSISVGLSAAFSTRSRAVGGAIGVYFVTVLLTTLQLIQAAIRYLSEELGLGLSDDAITFLQAVISPAAAYQRLFGELFFESNQAPAAEETVWFLQTEVMVGLLLVWIVVPLVLGYLVFRQSDLG
jgi:ABC-2 type transport system permease protein